MIPACRGVYGFRSLFYGPRRVFAEGDQHRMVTRPHGNVTSPAHFPRRFAAAGGERTHSLALRARTRWRVSPTSTQRQQVDRAFWSLPPHRGEAAYGVRELVPAFWSTAARKQPSSRVSDRHRLSLCDLSRLSVFGPCFVRGFSSNHRGLHIHRSSLRLRALASLR